MNFQYATFPWLSSILLCCIGGLLTILLIPGHRQREIKWVSAIYSGLTLVLSLHLFVSYDKTAGGFQFVERIPWVRIAGYSLFQRRGRVQPAHAAADRRRLFYGRADHVGADAAGQGVLRAAVSSGGRGVRAVHEPGSLFHFRLVSTCPFSHVPADCRSGAAPARNTGP